MEAPRIIQLPKFFDRRGNLSVIEEMVNVPFEISRCYWIYDVPGGEMRGGHAYRRNREMIIALSGSFDVAVTMAMNDVRSDSAAPITASTSRPAHGVR